ncbi:hypothetical protein C8R47DRAFT_1108845 [Mycena vitilis]|nr:hypothetical protein C8R47DRAFT_1108845 [Mycena vitilis]
MDSASLELARHLYDRPLANVKLSCPAHLFGPIHSETPDPERLLEWLDACTITTVRADVTCVENHPANRPNNPDTINALADMILSSQLCDRKYPILVLIKEWPRHGIRFHSDGRHPTDAITRKPVTLMTIDGGNRVSGLLHAIHQEAERGAGQSQMYAPVQRTWCAKILVNDFWDVLAPPLKHAVVCLLDVPLPGPDISHPATVFDQLTVVLRILLPAFESSNDGAKAQAILSLDRSLAPFSIFKEVRPAPPASKWRKGIRRMLRCPSLLVTLAQCLEKCPAFAQLPDLCLSNFIFDLSDLMTGCEALVENELVAELQRAAATGFAPEKQLALFPLEMQSAVREEFDLWMAHGPSHGRRFKDTCPQFFDAGVELVIQHLGGIKQARWLCPQAVAKGGWFRKEIGEVRNILRLVALVLGGTKRLLPLLDLCPGSRETRVTPSNLHVLLKDSFDFQSAMMMHMGNKRAWRQALEAIGEEVRQAPRTLCPPRIGLVLMDAAHHEIDQQCRIVVAHCPQTLNDPTPLAHALNTTVFASPALRRIVLSVGVKPGSPFEWAPAVWITQDIPDDEMPPPSVEATEQRQIELNAEIVSLQKRKEEQKRSLDRINLRLEKKQAENTAARRTAKKEHAQVVADWKSKELEIDAGRYESERAISTEYDGVVFDLNKLQKDLDGLEAQMVAGVGLGDPTAENDEKPDYGNSGEQDAPDEPPVNEITDIWWKLPSWARPQWLLWSHEFLSTVNEGTHTHIPIHTPLPTIRDATPIAEATSQPSSPIPTSDMSSCSRSGSVTAPDGHPGIMTRAAFYSLNDPNPSPEYPYPFYSSGPQFDEAGDFGMSCAPGASTTQIFG